MIGPAEPLPGTLWIMIPGLALLGVGVSAVQVTTLRTLNLYVTEDVIKMMKDEGKKVRPENLTGVADKASALFNFCFLPKPEAPTVLPDAGEIPSDSEEE